jgi:hypothetical protein
MNDMQMLRDAGFDEVVAEDRTDQVCHRSTIPLYRHWFSI